MALFRCPCSPWLRRALKRVTWLIVIALHPLMVAWRRRVLRICRMISWITRFTCRRSLKVMVGTLTCCRCLCLINGSTRCRFTMELRRFPTLMVSPLEVRRVRVTLILDWLIGLVVTLVVDMELVTCGGVDVRHRRLRCALGWHVAWKCRRRIIRL